MKPEKLITLLVVFAFIFALVCIVKAQAPAENMKTFFDSKIPGIKIQVNATAETQPTHNITVILSLQPQTNVYVKVEYFNMSIFGFLNGTDKIIMANITGNNFPLTDTPKEYNYTFTVSEQAWDVTYGEITLTYNATYTAEFGSLELPYRNITLGFTMTVVKNVYLEKLENDLEDLNESYQQLNNSYWELQQNYTALQGSLNELDNTRRAVIILAIAAVFFVATTVYLIMRKPKQYW